MIESLFNKVACLQDFRPATLLKRDSNTGTFLYILQIFNNSSFEELLRTATSEKHVQIQQSVTFIDLVAANFKAKFHLYCQP